MILLLGVLDQWTLSLVSLSTAFIELESRSSAMHRSVWQEALPTQRLLFIVLNIKCFLAAQNQTVFSRNHGLDS